MDPLYREQVEGEPDELRIGVASWDEIKKGGSGEQLSLKYAWPDKNGRVSRGGEVPMSALPQCVEFAIATEKVAVDKVLEAVARGYQRIGTVEADAD
jgi:hypothetical protein